MTAALPNQEFEAVAVAPSEGWHSDAAAGDSENPEFESALVNAFHREEGEWYDYDISTHSLTPEDITFAVFSTEGRYYKLRFSSYYDTAGSPAIITFRWAEIEPPEAP